MNILVVCQHYYPETFSLNTICEGLVKRGHHVTVLTALPSYGSDSFFAGYEKAFFEEHNGVAIHRVYASVRHNGAKSLLKNYYTFWKNAKKVVNTLGVFDVVFSMCLSPLTSILPASYYAKKHHVHHVHYCADIWPEVICATGYIKHKGPLFQRILRFSRRTYRDMAYIIVSSPSFASYLETVDRISSDKICYIPQPFVQDTKITGLYPFHHRFNFVYAGNVGTLQMVDRIVEAFGLLPKNIDAGLTLVGSGSHLDDVLAKARSLDLGDRFEYLGHKTPEETQQILGSCTGVFVTLKPTESPVSKTLPNKVISSLSLKKPIIASIAGDGYDVLKQANGTFFADSTPESLKDAILALIAKRPEELADMGENNYTFYKTNFDCETIINRFEQVLLDNCIDKNGK